MFDLNLQPPNLRQIHRDFWWANQPIFYVALTSLSSELVNATIKKVMALLEVGLTFALI
jgi:hypothetical protein